MKNKFTLLNTGKQGSFYFLLLALSVLWGCLSEEEYVGNTTDDVNMTEYFQRNSEKYSKFLEILERTGNASYLGAYGAYTAFAPTNEAVESFLEEKGVNSVEELDVEELKGIVKFHLIDDTLRTNSFTDGKLPKITMYGQYIITGAENTEGISKITINRQARMLEGNIKVGNGFIHSIDAVLMPATQTLAQILESNSDYSIFTDALRATGFYDTLNMNFYEGANSGKAWFTVFAQTDEVYKKEGINSFSDLKRKYSTTNDPSNPTDSLFLYVAYRILGDNKYLADIVGAASHATSAPKEVITSKLKGDSVLINEDIFNGVLEKGAPVNRALSDVSATNGVLHSVTKDYTVKLRMPVRVYFDVAEQPELMTIPGWHRPGALSIPIDANNLKYINTVGESTIEYVTHGVGDGNPRANYDHLRIWMRTSRIREIEITTPVLVKGRYKVWFCYRRAGDNGVTSMIYFNDQALAPITFSEGYPSGAGDERTLLSQGWKRYTYPLTNNSISRLAGVIEVETTDRHIIKLVSMTNDHTQPLWLDMIQFIPMEQDQLWPKVAEDGSLVHEPN